MREAWPQEVGTIQAEGMKGRDSGKNETGVLNVMHLQRSRDMDCKKLDEGKTHGNK